MTADGLFWACRDMVDGNGTPTRAEIEQQLEVMCSTARFRAAFSRAEFLRLVVTRTLDGQEITEDVIGPILFPKYAMDGDPRVRATAKNLRKSLREYYAGEGHHDLVVIALPEPSKNKRRAGEAYTPNFSYNSQHPAAAECALGDYHRERGSADCFKPALDHYHNALCLNPDYVQAQLGEIEVFFRYLELYNVSSESREKILSSVESSIARAELRAPNFWRTHAVKGTFLLLKREIAATEAAFSKALSLDQVSTQASKRYRDFLFETNRSPEALQLIKSFVDAHPDDLNARLQYSHALCRAKQFEEAEKVIDDVLRVEPTGVFAHMQKVRVLLDLGRREEARELAKCLRPVLGPLTYSYMANVVGLDEDAPS